VQEEVSGDVEEEAPDGVQEVSPCQPRCHNCGELGHRKNSPICHLNATRKRQTSSFMPIIVFMFHPVSNGCFLLHM
jgi:hypothetical protein